MNKSTLVDAVAERRQIPRKRAEAVVDLVFGMMVEAMRSGERVEVRGFGSFVARHYDAREGRNPRTAEPIHVKAKRLPFFKAGKELKARVDSGKGPLPVDTEPDGGPDADGEE